VRSTRPGWPIGPWRLARHEPLYTITIEKLDNSRGQRSRSRSDFGTDTIAHCRIGERSAHTWFVLHELLDLPNARNYDGSWTAYGSLVGVPIELGD
jgi:thiosulfate/3-mercaptopyruvate sulfurtransferase